MNAVSFSSLTTTWAARLVAAFDASGVHRVGTPGDLASGAWLAAEATQSGVAIARLPVPIQYTCVEEAYLACAGLRIDGVPLVDAQARFRVPVKFGDFVDVASEIGEFRRSSFDVTHRITLAGELAVEGRETRVWAGRDAEGRIRGKSIPDEVIGRFRTG